MKPLTLADAALGIETLLVERNPRGMATVQEALTPGYLLRAARCLLTLRELAPSATVALLTGFPVDDTVETDGPAGVHALYHALERAGLSPLIWTDPLVTPELFPALRTAPLPDPTTMNDSAKPEALIVIERPGAAADGRFYNIRGRDISDRCTPVEPLLQRLNCPIIAIGDGGNEVGMARAGEALKALPIVPAASSCHELIVADVSNWGGYALAALLDSLCGSATEANPDRVSIEPLLQQLVAAGAVDGVTGAATLTEDNFPAQAGDTLLAQIHDILQMCDPLAARPADNPEQNPRQQPDQQPQEADD